MYGPDRDQSAGCIGVLLAVVVLIVCLVIEVAFDGGWPFWRSHGLTALATFTVGVVVGFKLGRIE